MGEVEAKLARHGVAAAGDVITSAMAAARLLEPGERVLVCGGPGVVEAVEGRGAVVVRDGLADAVLVGFHREFDYERLRIAAAAVRGGARLLATNDDATYPTPEGRSRAAGRSWRPSRRPRACAPIVAGKPHRPMVDLVRDRLGDARRDGGGPSRHRRGFARALGFAFALVHSGVTDEAQIVDPPPDLVAADLRGARGAAPAAVLTLASTPAAIVGSPSWPRTTSSSATSTPASRSRPSRRAGPSGSCGSW